jgi:hypothetical protein
MIVTRNEGETKVKLDVFLLKWSYVNLVVGFVLIIGMGLLSKHSDGFVVILEALVAIAGGAFALLGVLYSIRRITWKRR